MCPLLCCKDLHRSYESTPPLEVLKGVDLTVGRGEIAAILGPSGTGKSTLMHLLAGLDTPDRGEIWWEALPIHAYRPQKLSRLRSKRIGLVFQQHYLLEDLTVLENATLPGRLTGELEIRRGEALLEAVGLSQRSSAYPKTLSGGEKQRLAVARALYHRPPVVLADEPTGSLDRGNARVVYQLLVDLCRENGTSVVMVTHDEALVDEIDRKYRLLDGVLVPAE
jgi:lipoprotein-releasing system ATP-binding protein